jgi:hypothetical protein
VPRAEDKRRSRVPRAEDKRRSRVPRAEDKRRAEQRLMHQDCPARQEAANGNQVLIRIGSSAQFGGPSRQPLSVLKLVIRQRRRH